MSTDATFWNNVAEDYAARPVELPEAFERKIEITIGRMKPDDAVLDIGCGTGSLALRLAPFGGELHGLDISEEMIRIAKGKAEAQDVRNACFHVGPFDESFDTFEDGSLDQMLVSPVPLSALGLGKTLAHWLTSGLPLVVVSPVVAITFQMPFFVTGYLMLTLLLGTISLSLLGSIGAALTVGLHRGTALLSLLILPMAMPILIFGARTVSLAAAGDAFGAGIYFLGAYCMLALTLAPFATAAALRISNE